MSKTNSYYLPGVNLSGNPSAYERQLASRIDPLDFDLGRLISLSVADSKWDLITCSQGPENGLISDYKHQSKIKELADPNTWPLRESQFGSTGEIPVYTGNERQPGKTLFNINGVWVPACTRGCGQKFRENICYHGVKFDLNCVDTCLECRKPHRGSRGWKQPLFQDSDFKSPAQILYKEFPGLQAVWENQLADTPWSEEASRGKDQSLSYLMNAERKFVIVPVFEDIYGNLLEASSSPRIVTHEDRSKEHKLLRALGCHHIQASQKIARAIPTWTIDEKFVKEFINWLYPNESTQREKRINCGKLIQLYFRAQIPQMEMLEDLGLSEKGLEAKIARLKRNAKLFLEEKASVSGT